MRASRSRTHLFAVLAERLDCEGLPPAVLKDLRLLAKEHAARRADGRDYSREDEKRIERQRTLMNFVAPSDALTKLRGAMAQRAYDLLWDGDSSACDAVLEFLPSVETDAVLVCWSNDQDNKAQKSKFYGADA